MTAPSLMRYRVAIAQTIIHTITIEASDEDAAMEIAEDRYTSDPGLMAYTPPEPWGVEYSDFEIEEWDLIGDDAQPDGDGGGQ
jgi:hypothetical protein